MSSFFERSPLTPKFDFHAGLSLEEFLRLFAVAPVISFTISCIKRGDVNSHVFVRDTIAIEGERVTV